MRGSGTHQTVALVCQFRLKNEEVAHLPVNGRVRISRRNCGGLSRQACIENKVENGTVRASKYHVSIRLDFEPLGRKTMMKLSLAAVLILGMSAISPAQQTTYYKGKKTAPRPAKSAATVPVGKAVGGSTAAGNNAKDLQLAERQSAKGIKPDVAAKKKPPVKTAQLKDKPAPPMNFNGSTPKSNGGLNRTAKDPYKGRLKQKNSSNNSH